MTIVFFTAHCPSLLGRRAALTNHAQIITSPSRNDQSSPVQSSPLHLPTHPSTPLLQAHDDHTQAQATTRRSRLRETISYPCRIVFLLPRHRTSSHPEPVQPVQPSVHQCASVSRLPSSPVRPDCQSVSASLPCPVPARLSTFSAVSSRLVPCHRPRLLCNLAPIWSCHSILTAPSTPDSVACLLARSLATRQSVSQSVTPPTRPSHFLAGSQNTPICPGHQIEGTWTYLLVRVIPPNRPDRTGCFRQLGADRWARGTTGSTFGPKRPPPTGASPRTLANLN